MAKSGLYIGLKQCYTNYEHKKADDFLAKLENPLKEEMAVLRDAIMEVHPEITKVKAKSE